MNILLTLSYDGTNYSGWQIQENSVTIQQKLEGALSKCFHTEIKVRGASRTDAGVHAMGQRVKFSVDTVIPLSKIPLVINPYLPDDIVIRDAMEVSGDFHPQYSAVKKTYEYRILNDRVNNPMLRHYTAWIKRQLDISLMRKAAEYFIGTHDFKAFSNKGSNQKTTVRTIYELDVSKSENIITVRISGDGFLYNMVRIIAGNLVYVGQGKILYTQIPQIMMLGDRSAAGKTLPPNGLVLMEIFYERGDGYGENTKNTKK